MSDFENKGVWERKKAPLLAPTHGNCLVSRKWKGNRGSPGQVSVTRLGLGQQPDRSLSFFPDQSSPRELPCLEPDTGMGWEGGELALHRGRQRETGHLSSATRILADTFTFSSSPNSQKEPYNG